MSFIEGLPPNEGAPPNLGPKLPFGMKTPAQKEALIPAVDKPKNFKDASLPNPRSRPDLNRRVYEMLSRGAEWMPLQYLYAFADSGISDDELYQINEHVRKLTISGVQKQLLKPGVNPAQQGLDYQQKANKAYAEMGGTNQKDDIPGGPPQAGVVAAIHGAAAVSTAEKAIQAADDGFKHFWDDPVLQKHPSAMLVVRSYLSNVLGPAPIAGDTLEHSQRQLQAMGFGRDLEADGTMSAGWGGAFAQWKNSIYRSQLSGNKPGSISVDHALKALSAITPGEAWPAIYNWITAIPHAGRQLLADLAGGVAGTLHNIEHDQRLPFFGGEQSQGEAEAFGQTASDVTNALWGNTTPKEQTHLIQNDPGRLILEDGINILLMGSMLKAGSSFYDAAAMERLASTNPEMAANLTKDAAFRGPGVIARSLSSEVPGTTVWEHLPIMRNIGPVVNSLADGEGLYYQLRNFTHSPYTWVGGEGGAAARAEMGLAPVSGVQGAIGTAARLGDVAFQQSLMQGAKIRGAGEIQQFLTGGEETPFQKNINKNTPIDELNDALGTFNFAGVHPLNLDDLMFVFGGAGAHALHQSTSESIGRTAAGLQRGMIDSLHEVGVSEGVSRLYKGKSIVRLSKEFGGTDNFGTFIWGKIYDEAARFAAQNEYDRKLMTDGLPVELSSSERVERIRDIADGIRNDPEALHKALGDLMSQGGGNELYVRLKNDMHLDPDGWDPIKVQDRIAASNHVRDNVMPWADTTIGEVEAPTAIGKNPKILDHPEKPLKGLRKGYVRLFRGETPNPGWDALPDASKARMSERSGSGRWWTVNPNMAGNYGPGGEYEGSVYYIDVTKNQLEKFASGTNPETAVVGGHDFSTIMAGQRAGEGYGGGVFIAPEAERTILHPADQMFPHSGPPESFGIIPKGTGYTLQDANAFNREMQEELASIRAREAYAPDEYAYMQRQTSVGEEHLNPATPDPGPKPTPAEILDWNYRMEEHLHNVYGIRGNMMPQEWEDKLAISMKLAERHLPLRLNPHPDAPAALIDAMNELDAKGYTLVRLKDMGHRINDVGPMEELKGGLTFRRKLAENIGMNPDNIFDATIGQEAQNQILGEIKNVIDNKGVQLGPGQTPASIIKILRSHGVLPEANILKGKMRQLFGGNDRLKTLLGVEEAEAMTTQLPLRDARRKDIVKALMDPEIMMTRDPASYDMWQMQRTVMNATDEPPWMSERDANLIAHAIVKGYSKVPTAFTGLNHIEDMFRGMGFMGLGMENKLGYAMANLPNKLIQVRNQIRFDLSPMFDFRRVFKTNVKMASEGIPPTWDPIKALVQDGKWEQARQALIDARPSHFTAEALGYADNADRYLAAQGVFHYNQLGFETYAAYWLKENGLKPAEIDEKLVKLFQYGNRTGMERSTNFLFFPFSFEKSLYKVMGAYILDKPAQRLILTQGMAAYDQFNKEHMDGSNPLATSFYNKHLPLFAEASRINAFTQGISMGEPGGINRPLLNLFLPQSWSPSSKSQDLLEEFIPALKDFSRIYEEAQETGHITRDWADNLWRDYIAPDKATVANPRRSTLTANEDLSAGFDMYLHLQKKYHQHIVDGDTIPISPEWGEFSGKKITNQVLRQIVAKAHPAYSAEGAATYVITQNQNFDNHLNSIRGTPQADGKYHGPLLLDGDPAYPYESSFREAVNTLAYDLTHSDNPAKFAGQTEALRKAAMYIAERDADFYKLYPKTFGRILGPLEAVK